jgi:hypothetical protein
MPNDTVPAATTGLPVASMSPDSDKFIPSRRSHMTREEAQIAAKEFCAAHSDLLRIKTDKKKFERSLAQRLRFEAHFNEWLKIRGEGGWRDDDEADEKMEQEDELALLILTTPAVHEWMIFDKFEVIEHYLTVHCETWTERLALVALAGIKTDLKRFGIKDED